MSRSKVKTVRPRKQGEGPADHWLGFGVEGQDALLLDLDPYLYCADQTICHLSQQVAFAAPVIPRTDGEDRPKAAILSHYDLNPWTVGYLSEKFDVALVTNYVDPIVDRTADRFDAIVLDEEEFYLLEPVFDFVLRFECAEDLDKELLETVSKVWDIMLPGGLALFPILSKDENISKETRESWIKSTIGFRNFSAVEIERSSPAELKKLQDFGVTEFAKRHRRFYGKEARDICLKRIYERDFQEVVEDEKSLVDLVVCTR